MIEHIFVSALADISRRNCRNKENQLKGRYSHLPGIIEGDWLELVSRLPLKHFDLAFGASKRSATSRAGTSCRLLVRQLFVLDWPMPSRTCQQRGVTKTWRLPFSRPRAND